MTSQKILKSMSDGEIVLRLYNPETDHEGVFSLLREIYMKESNVFRALEMNKPEAITARDEFENMVKLILKEDVSVVAHHLPSDEIVGLAMNMVHMRPKPGRLNPYEETRETIRSREFKKMFDFNVLADKELNLFDRYNTDCVFECKYLATHSDFRMRDIAYNLMQCSVELAKTIDMKGIKPTIAYGKFGSKYSERIGEKLGCVVVQNTPINELKIDGVPLSSKVAPQDIHRHDRGVTLLKL